jgi:hypothetical protein
MLNLTVLLEDSTHERNMAECKYRRFIEFSETLRTSAKGNVLKSELRS